MMPAIDAAMPAEEIGRRARRPGCQVNTVLPLVDRQLLRCSGRKVVGAWSTRQRDDRRRGVDGARLLGAGRARVPRRRHAPGVGHRRRTPYDDGAIATAASTERVAVDDEDRIVIKRSTPRSSNYSVPALLRHARRVTATPVRTRCLGTTGRSLLVRDFYRLAQERLLVERRRGRRALPQPHRGARARRRRSFASPTSARRTTTPEDYLDHLVRLRPLHDRRQRGALRPRAARRARRRSSPPCARRSRAHYRNIAAMDRDEKIRCGAYVYFSFLRPFARGGGHRRRARLDRAARHPASALRVRVDARRRQHREQHGRRVLRLDPVTTVR